MPKIFQWIDIKDHLIGGALLLGNGASMAIHPDFGYASLRFAAEEHGHFTPEVAKIFQLFKTDDFELVLRHLWEATLVNKALGVEPGKVETAYQQVRQALISTVRQVHIPYNNAKQYLEPMFHFMKNFHTIFCLNYDLLVYWAMMASKPTLGNWFKDCFQEKGVFSENWEKLREPYRADGSTLVFYPHGNLIAARIADYTEIKIGRVDYENLVERIFELWSEGEASPLFVSEATSEHKRKSIANSNYLTRVFREVIPNSGDSLVIYGWAASEQDEHIFSQLHRSGTRLRRVAISIYKGCEVSVQRMEDMFKDFDAAEVLFFDAESPGCWIHSQKKAQQ